MESLSAPTGGEGSGRADGTRPSATAERPAFTGIPEQLLLRVPKAQELSWVDLLILLGLLVEHESKSIVRLDESPRLRRLAEVGWTYEVWLRAGELLLECAFPRRKAIRHVKLKDSRFRPDHVPTMLRLLTLARGEATASRRWLALWFPATWALRLARSAIAFFWIALVCVMPLSTFASLLIVWLSYLVTHAFELLLNFLLHGSRRKTIVLRPPPRPGRFILYLRAFRRDESAASPRGLPLQYHASPIPSIWAGRPFSDRLARAMAPLGPVLALGWPSDGTIDTLGIPTLALPEDDWREYTLAVARDAAVIVVDAHTRGGSGHTWELQRVLESDLLDKTIFVLPYDSPPTVHELLVEAAFSKWDESARLGLLTRSSLGFANPARLRYDRLQRFMADFSLTLPDYEPDALFFYFDAGQKAHVVPWQPREVDGSQTDGQRPPGDSVRTDALKLLRKAFPKVRAKSLRSALDYKLGRLALLVVVQSIALGVALWAEAAWL